MTVVNQKGYPDPDAPDVPPGEYLCQIKKIESQHKVSNDQTAERWFVQGTILDGPHKGQYWDDNWIFNSSNMALQRRQVLILNRVGGYPKDFEGGFDRKDFIGKKVLVTFIEDTYKGKTRHKVDFGGYKSVESATLEQEATPKATHTQDPNEEDIPF